MTLLISGCETVPVERLQFESNSQAGTLNSIIIILKYRKIGS